MLFDLRSFNVQIRCLVFRLSVPFGLGSFGLGSLFGLGSNSAFCLSTFCHSTFGHSTFCHSTFCLSTLCRWILPSVLGWLPTTKLLHPRPLCPPSWDDHQLTSYMRWVWSNDSLLFSSPSRPQTQQNILAAAVLILSIVDQRSPRR
jgi:hypothetical protein